ncbi:DNA mismatch repair protein MutS2 [Deferribacter desulfuricans SSM1]|uniref:Endonuclease MutS2 n=1 Tax=Deferribacter desulfuricans (strain DSM 14783 / JCM 11476 / NBRC 101012 / SSM1) TaxID=639282 RepID=D3P8K4_DEFDS|nr:Smr/MutS family protein [Deferribacter desulfuricans]BAI81044.1 DNA mismatch repair protein MutS2 [Deferribacter desulfuricans SSM1]
MINTQQLEFEIYKDLIKKKFISSFSIKYLENLKPYQVSNKIIETQQYINEILNFLAAESIKIENDSDYFSFYNKLMDPYESFTSKDLVIFKNFHTYLRDIKKILTESKQINKLKNILKEIYTFSNLTQEINEKIGNDGTVKSNATAELAKIRKDIQSVSKQLDTILKKILYGKNSDKFIQERTIVIRNDRFVIPCKPNFRQFLNGIIHDLSKTAQTVFVEPSETVELNNKYQSLKIAEDEEIRKIINESITKIKSHRLELSNTISNYEKLIFFLEYALFVKDFDITFPEINDNIKFKKIHHPIIFLHKKEGSIPIDIEFENNKNLIVISGPNTGGKTAALKSLGLNHILAMCGLPLFGQYAEVKIFKNILADIGDNQSLIMDLSTFSSHMVNIKKIIESSDNNSLILLDELGTGTDPKEGAILAVAILKYLVDKGGYIAVTTHFNEVKEFALKNSFAENYAVDFDYETFTPKYNLLKGVLGKSDPILIAKKLKFNPEVIEIAEKLLKEKKGSIEFEIEKINEIKLETELLKKSLENKKAELEEKEKQLEEKIKEFNNKLQQKEEKLLEEAFTLLQKGKNLIKNSKQYSPNEIDKDLKIVSKKLNKIKEKKPKITDIKIGDKILLEKYNKIAEILEIKKDTVYVNLEGIKIELKKSDLIGEKIKNKTFNKKLDIKSDVKKDTSWEINVIGKRADEALSEVDKFIDKAVLSGVNSVYIIHGRGTGILKNIIRDFLKNDPRVKSFRAGTFHEGGDAVTVVEF